MKQFEAKVQNSCLRKRLNIYLLQIINKISFLFHEHQPNASAPMGWRLAPAGNTLHKKTLTSICIYASKTISLQGRISNGS
jgi:hypothetical protein